MKKILLGITLIFLMFSCAHHKDVRPGEGGLNSVTIKTDDTHAGSREAMDQANDYCKTKNKSAIIVNEKSTYHGEMDESTYKTAKKVSKAAGTVGAGVWTLGGTKESNIGGTTGVVGAVGDQVLGEEYTVNMTFKCE